MSEHEDDIPAGDDYAFDGGSYGQSDLGSGDQINKDGWYHCEVSDVVLDLDTLSHQGKSKSPSIRFDLTVLETVTGQSPAGSRLFHRIYVGGNGGILGEAQNRVGQTAGGQAAANAAGGNGGLSHMAFFGTGGAGGSANSSTGAANKGGNGGLYGGGGGGGSGSLNAAGGDNSGGDGAQGIVVITTYF